MALPDDPAFLPPEPAATTLELADVPRRARPTVPPGPAGVLPSPTGLNGRPAGTSGAAPSGTALDAPTPAWRRPVNLGLAVTLLGLVVLAVIIYRKVTRADVVAIPATYRTNIGMVIDLPGRTGWKTDRRYRQTKRSGDRWARTEAMFRGPSLDAADDSLMVFRIHAAGAFPALVDLDQLRAQAQQMAALVSYAGQLDVNRMQCQADQVLRTDPAASCRGSIQWAGRDYAVGIYLWQATVDDILGLFYLTTSGDLAGFDTVVRSARD